MSHAYQSHLDALGVRYGSDKSSQVHNYLAFYETFLAPIKDLPVTILEFCHTSPAALLMWRDYFPKGKIVGVFRDDTGREFQQDRITIEIGKQFDRQFLHSLRNRYRLDVVIDDGFHHWIGQIATLEELLPALEPGGFFVIEDLHTSVGEPMRLTYGLDGTVSTLDFLTQIAGQIVAGASSDHAVSACARASDSIIFHSRACVIARGSIGAEVYKERARDVATKVFDLDNGGAYKRIPAEIIDAPAWMSKNWQIMAANSVVEPPPAQLCVLENVLVHDRGLITTENMRTLVEESLINTKSNTSVGPLRRDQSEDRFYIARPVSVTNRYHNGPFVLLKQHWDGNYGHWLIESLPRVDLVAEVYGNLTGFRFVVAEESHHMKRVYLDTLRLFDVDEDQVIFTSGACIHFHELLYPCPLTIQPWIKAPRVVRTIEAIVERFPATGGSSILYVSRNKTQRRVLINEDEIIAIVRSAGGTVVHPEELSFEQQVRTFKNAKLVIGSLGGALTNIVFCPKGVQLLALTTEFMQDDFFWDLIGHKEGTYISIHGRALDPAKGMQSDFALDRSKFEAIFERAIKRVFADYC